MQIYDEKQYKIAQYISEFVQWVDNTKDNVPQPPSLLVVILYLTFVTLVLCCMPKDDVRSLRRVALIGSIAFFIACIILWNKFDKSRAGFQFICEIPIIPEYHVTLSFGLDGVSLCFLLLTGFIMPFCVFASNTVRKNYKKFIIQLFVVEIFITTSFLTTNILFFFVFFEGVLIPMFLMIGSWGGRDRKIFAAYYFVLYTIFGSFFLLYGIYSIYNIYETLDYQYLLNVALSHQVQLSFWIFFFLPFAIKIPMVPFHLWLPEAHVEAPTIGSVILASLLLKLGGYGFLRFTIPMFEHANALFFPFIGSLAVFAVIIASLASMRQNDLKRIIAYSSVAHMNLVVLGLFSYSHHGIDGAIYLMLAHGIVSAALFFCIGVLYDRYHSRSLKYYSGLAQVMPVFCGYFFLFTLGNMAFPGMSNFVGEFLIFVGLFEYHSVIMVAASTGVVLSAVYSIWLFNRVSFGTLKTDTESISSYADLNRPEIYILVVLAAAMFALGLYSTVVTTTTCVAIKKILWIASYKS